MWTYQYRIIEMTLARHTKDSKKLTIGVSKINFRVLILGVGVSYIFSLVSIFKTKYFILSKGIKHFLVRFGREVIGKNKPVVSGGGQLTYLNVERQVKKRNFYVLHFLQTSKIGFTC